MSSADSSKPPRPCTEYNIFFQLERAYILQVVLNADPNVDDAEAFHPSQATYAGRPPLPRRYASLVLPYDWHLPGKEARRKRKHRKTHGVIGFHDLSGRVSAAWKSADDDVRTYCARVCAIGMMRYKAAVKEWKLRGGAEPGKDKKRKQVHAMAKMRTRSSFVQRLEETKSSAILTQLTRKEPEPVMSFNNHSLPPLPDTVRSVQVASQQEQAPPIPTLATSEAISLEEMDRAFENDLLLGGEMMGLEVDDVNAWSCARPSAEPLILEPALAPVSSTKLRGPSEPLLLEPALATVSTELVLSANSSCNVENGKKKQRRLSIVSNEPEPADVADGDIMNMWNGTNDGRDVEKRDAAGNNSSQHLRQIALMVELERLRQRTMAACMA